MAENASCIIINHIKTELLLGALIISSDLIHSMRPDPGSEGVNVGLHAIRLTNHRRIFLTLRSTERVMMVGQCYAGDQSLSKH